MVSVQPEPRCQTEDADDMLKGPLCTFAGKVNLSCQKINMTYIVRSYFVVPTNVQERGGLLCRDADTIGKVKLTKFLKSTGQHDQRASFDDFAIVLHKCVHHRGRIGHLDKEIALCFASETVNGNMNLMGLNIGTEESANVGN